MRARNRLAFESLELRQMLSANSELTPAVAEDDSAAIVVSESASPSGTVSMQSASSGDSSIDPGENLSARQFLNTSGAIQTVSGRWDWLANTEWYVPAENLLAYSANTNLSDPTAIADQTLWLCTESNDGVIKGQSITKLSTEPVPIVKTISGVITDSGQVRLEFTGTDTDSTTTIGVGQMRLIDGAWHIEMQMGTENNSLITHWAYMAQLANGQAAPEPGDSPSEDDLRSDEWHWLLGTEWTIHDSELFGPETNSGTFEIEGYRDGYYWGTGTDDSGQPFNVLGSVTPEGNVLLMASVDDGSPGFRSGILQTTYFGAQMTFRSYDSSPTIGYAWTVTNHDGPIVGPFLPGAREFLSSGSNSE